MILTGTLRSRFKPILFQIPVLNRFFGSSLRDMRYNPQVTMKPLVEGTCQGSSKIGKFYRIIDISIENIWWGWQYFWGPYLKCINVFSKIATKIISSIFINQLNLTIITKKKRFIKEYPNKFSVSTKNNQEKLNITYKLPTHVLLLN